MLGLLYNVSRGVAAPSLQGLFQRQVLNLHTYVFQPGALRHNWQLHDPVEVGHPIIILRSVFGLIARWNSLGSFLVGSPNVKIFQKRLQQQAKSAAGSHVRDWRLMFRRPGLDFP